MGISGFIDLGKIMERNETKYTLEKLIGHLSALEDHIRDWECQDCLIKHKSAVGVYFDELLNYINTEEVKKLKEEFMLLDLIQSDEVINQVRNIRKVLIQVYIQQEFK